MINILLLQNLISWQQKILLQDQHKQIEQANIALLGLISGNLMERQKKILKI